MFEMLPVAWALRPQSKTCGLNGKSNLVLDGRKCVTVFWFTLAVWKFSSLLELMLFPGIQI